MVSLLLLFVCLFVVADVVVDVVSCLLLVSC